VKAGKGSHGKGVVSLRRPIGFLETAWSRSPATAFIEMRQGNPVLQGREDVENPWSATTAAFAVFWHLLPHAFNPSHEAVPAPMPTIREMQKSKAFTPILLDPV